MFFAGQVLGLQFEMCSYKCCLYYCEHTCSFNLHKKSTSEGPICSHRTGLQHKCLAWSLTRWMFAWFHHLANPAASWPYGSGPFYIQDMLKQYTPVCPVQSATCSLLWTGPSYCSTKSQMFQSGQQKLWTHTVADWTLTHNQKLKNVFFCF